MVQKNFILTDVMKTGDHITYEQFIDLHSLPNQHFEYTGEYYTLHNYNLNNYDRKIAFIDTRIHNDRVVDNQDYKRDLQNRLQYLNSQGFKFIMANPWESLDNIKSQVFIGGKKLKNLDIPFDYYIWTGSTSWFWSFMYNKHINSNFNFDHNNKKFTALYLNKLAREHRLNLFTKIKENNLLKNSLYTFLGLENPIRLSKEYELPWCDPMQYPRWGLDQDLYEKPYNETVYSLISETNDTNNEIFITEKLWKPIIAKHIFVVYGNYQYLKKIKELGFKTFENIIDESYDNEIEPINRINKIVKVCQKLDDIMYWKELYQQTEEIREHNYKTFFNKELLSKTVNSTILDFLKFVDSR
jgi:hypothetical protein